MKDDLPGATQEEVAKHIPGLDGVRGLAILMVMFSHFIKQGDHLNESLPLHRLISSGFLGVDLFFVLSGFLITGILVEAKKKSHYFRTFYIRRALRIFPLYYLVLAVAFLSVPLLSPEDAPKLTGADSPWWYWLYASNIGMAFKGDWLTSPTWVDLGHFWSLAVEEQFYMVWPLVVFFVNPKWLFRLCLLLVITNPLVMGWLYLTIGDQATYTSTLSRTGLLAAGGLLAVVWKNPARKPRWMRMALPVFCLSGLLLLLDRTFFGKHLAMYEPLIMLFCGAACVALASKTTGFSFFRRFFESDLLRWFGKYSYGIYVYHHALRSVWVHFIWERLAVPLVGPGWAGTAIYFIVATAATLSLSWLSWHFFEAKILSLKRHFTYDSAKV
ncbi:acyltransferase family protein [Luteolibacter luteus]|uniref:Acyltransferase n=1 Tax=Luteolibacter luteus TaxID=2728835 RepID=A0A858RHL5_9BACT|nr:acyltransferase [Luteolibacter luteus]QJE96322.1 acyltransferase [Luteolibacter luteus]